MQSELKWGNMYAVCSCEQTAENGLFYQQILTVFVSDSVYYWLRESMARFCSTCRSVLEKKYLMFRKCTDPCYEFQPASVCASAPRRQRLVTGDTTRWDEVIHTSLQALSHCSGRKRALSEVKKWDYGGTKGVREGGETSVIDCNNLKWARLRWTCQTKAKLEKTLRAESRDPSVWRKGVL